MRDQNEKMSSAPETTAVGHKHDPSIKNPLVNYGQLPGWRQENQYIVTKYRSARNSYRQSIKSLTYLHNETGNIYTHLLFLVIVLLVTTYNLPQLGGPKQWFPSPRNGDILALSAFLGGVVLCMSFSVTYHIVLDHSESVATAGKQLDFAGITCLIWGCLIATLYYTFTCEVELMRTYMLIFTALGAIMLLFFASPLASKSWAQALVVPLFVAFAAAGIFPLWRGIQMYGWERMGELAGLRWGLACGFVCLASLVPFMTRFPERWKQGKFDLWLSSHQIFHIAVVIAACLHFVGLMKAYSFQHMHMRIAICPMLSTWKDELMYFK
ncbi:hypothetical protein J4E90_010208 [Alternaria incomplexa]|uniref:uncharacterized protein n=1 Tax=Alternaria incomplexa TaxID=1187928 RepID=UPI00221F1A79|nr:uncharacterized protein J4E90_010208 [Alternaria incomplexa]KAI4906749.1 hypothetical protein J4E90_010208 [Alternaria incomplexa]